MDLVVPWAELIALIEPHYPDGHRHGLKVVTGTIVDPTLLHALSSTKNKDGKRDPEMRQVRKGNQWYFGMKAHVGGDVETS